MRALELAAIAVLCVGLFFPVYWLFALFVPSLPAAILAAVLLYAGFPLLLMRCWLGPWGHSLRQTLDFVVLVAVLGAFGWFLYSRLSWPEYALEAMVAVVCGLYGAVYYWLTGREPFAANRSSTRERGLEE